MFYLNSHYPNLFAATLYVSSQWDVEQLEKLKNQKFFYIASAGDQNASTGQRNLMKMLKQDHQKYSQTTLDANLSPSEKNTAVNQLLDKNRQANFITWKAGTVMKYSDKPIEHNASFDFGYTIPSVRNWLFNQSK